MVGREELAERKQNGKVRIDVRRDAITYKSELLAEARAGLGQRPRELSPKWLYDERGCRLYEQITQLPEYYPFRREREILRRCAAQVAQRYPAEILVELGAGTSEKTRLLLDALKSTGRLRVFSPLDVSEATLVQSARQLSEAYPELQLRAVVGDFEKDLRFVPGGGRRLVAFLGGTVGNLKPRARAQFYRALGETLSCGELLLLGTDLIKDRRRLDAAYDDSRGVTAAFNLNVLTVLNRELGADFAARRFAHEARFVEELGWVEMLLRARERHTVRLPALGLELLFERGEPLRTEVSTKFRPEQVDQELTESGFEPVEWWTDDRGDYALSLWRRR